MLSDESEHLFTYTGLYCFYMSVVPKTFGVESYRLASGVSSVANALGLTRHRPVEVAAHELLMSKHKITRCVKFQQEPLALLGKSLKFFTLATPPGC